MYCIIGLISGAKLQIFPHTHKFCLKIFTTVYGVYGFPIQIRVSKGMGWLAPEEVGDEGSGYGACNVGEKGVACCISGLHYADRAEVDS